MAQSTYEMLQKVYFEESMCEIKRLYAEVYSPSVLQLLRMKQATGMQDLKQQAKLIYGDLQNEESLWVEFLVKLSSTAIDIQARERFMCRNLRLDLFVECIPFILLEIHKNM